MTNTPERDTMKTITELLQENDVEEIDSSVTIVMDGYDWGTTTEPHYIGTEAQLLATIHAYNAQQATPKLTKEQAIVITGFTGVMAVNSFADFHADVEKRLGRSVWTHQFPELDDEIKAAYKDDFIAMVMGE